MSTMTATPADANTNAMPDVQASQDARAIAIDKVGVRNVAFPLTLKTKSGHNQTATAMLNMYVSLPHDKKGTHMSRFMEVLNNQSDPLSPSTMMDIAHTIRERLHANDAHIEASFKYFISRPAPVTGMAGFIDYEVRIEANSSASQDGSTITDDFILTVGAPATSLCPCSKEISAYGAHNQRCLIEASVRFDGEVWIEDLVEHLENAASCRVYPVLKRQDEKHVTEKAYENPKFVEDIVRDLAIKLNNDDRISQYTISSTNFESIHNHDAYAEISRDKRES